MSELTFKVTDKEEKEALLDYIRSLVELNSKRRQCGLEILIKDEDCDIMSVTVNEKEYRHDEPYNSQFILVGPEEFVAKEVILPDNTFETVPACQSDEEVIQRFLDEHPGEWKRSELTGRWINIAEEKALEKEFGINNKKEKKR